MVPKGAVPPNRILWISPTILYGGSSHITKCDPSFLFMHGPKQEKKNWLLETSYFHIFTYITMCHFKSMFFQFMFGISQLKHMCLGVLWEPMLSPSLLESKKPLPTPTPTPTPNYFILNLIQQQYFIKFLTSWVQMQYNLLSLMLYNL